MTRVEIVAAVAAQCNITKKAAEEAIVATFDAMKEALAAKEDISLRGFGTFKAKAMAATKGRNPKTGGAVAVPARFKPTFKASSGLKAAMNK